MMTLLVIAGLNTVISLIYYLRVAKIVSIDPEPENRGPVTLGVLPTVYVLLVALPVVIYGIQPGRILEIAHQATQQLVHVEVVRLVVRRFHQIAHARCRLDFCTQHRAGRGAAFVPAVRAVVAALGAAWT